MTAAGAVISDSDHWEPRHGPLRVVHAVMGWPVRWVGERHERPGLNMLESLPNSDLIAYRTALEAAGIALALVAGVPAPLKTLADQVIRSASSVPANLAEGHGRNGRDRAHHWRIAYASAMEVDCHLRLLYFSGAVHRGKATTALQLFDEVRAMTWWLLHPVSCADLRCVRCGGF